MQVKVNKLEKEKEPKDFSMETLCPFPLDKDLYMPPFPKRVEMPKYNKYDGNSDPQDHVREFCTQSMEFMHEPTYLMCLFPRSLGGETIHWFSRMPPTIKTFEELIKLFYQQYSYNIKHLITMIDICNLKQYLGEPFLTFLK